MSNHRIYIPTVHAEHMLELPDGVHLTAAWVEDGELVLGVASKDDLGATEKNALYGNVEEDDIRLTFGMLEDRTPARSSQR